MEKFESLENNLNSSKKIIEKHLKELKKIKDKISFNSKKQDIENELEEYSEFVDLFEIELTDATPTETEQYYPKFEMYRDFAQEVEQELQESEAKMKKKWDAKQQVSYEAEQVNLNKPSNQKKMEQMTADELNKDIENKLDMADMDIDEIIKTLSKTRNLGNEINQEIIKQQERLDLIRDDINECYSLSKRSAKLLNYFKKNIMTDKLICVFIILICIAIIVIIGLRIAGYQTDSFDPSVVPNQTTETDAVTTA